MNVLSSSADWQSTDCKLHNDVSVVSNEKPRHVSLGWISCCSFCCSLPSCSEKESLYIPLFLSYYNQLKKKIIGRKIDGAQTGNEWSLEKSSKFFENVKIWVGRKLEWKRTGF
jgi:hypothetical protein